VTGNGNIVAGRDVHQVTVHVEKIVAARTPVKTGDGVIDALQKRRLQDLCHDIVTISAQVESAPSSHAKVMSALHRRMKVNSYAEIKAEAFGQAVSYLTRWRARLNSHPQARSRSENWRRGRIAAIQARCTEKGWQEWRHAYMLERFGRNSLVNMPDTEIEQLYRTVMSKV
jgi:hypothetical protein